MTTHTQGPLQNLEEDDSREPLLAPPLERTALSREASLSNLSQPAPGPEFNRLFSWKPLLGMSTGMLLTFLCIGLVSIAILVGLTAGGNPPMCRKSAALAVMVERVSAAGAKNLGSKGSNNRTLSTELLVWSGMGRHRIALDDLHGFDLASHQWRTLRARQGLAGWLWRAGSDPKRPAAGAPWPRWKAGTAQTASGMVVFGGDAYPARAKHRYESDLWLLEQRSLKWRRAWTDPEGAGPAGPAPRRAHSTVLYTDPASGEDRMVVFGGRRHDGVLLSDSWEAALRWPNVTWHLLRRGAEEVPQGGSIASGAGSAEGGASFVGEEEGGKSKKGAVPPARKGHIAVLVDDGEVPQMLIHGGRDNSEYLGDLWLLDLARGEWRQIEAVGPLAPKPRDHHGAAYSQGTLYIFGGRSGPTYELSRPMDDLWAFSMRTLTWRQVPQSGASPLPRFLYSYVQYTPPGATDPRLLVFGGETLSDCRLNDVWELSLSSPKWSLLSPPEFCSRKCRRAFGG